jgi:hypothetical protein
MSVSTKKIRERRLVWAKLDNEKIGVLNQVVFADGTTSTSSDPMFFGDRATDCRCGGPRREVDGLTRTCHDRMRVCLKCMAVERA